MKTKNRVLSVLLTLLMTAIFMSGVPSNVYADSSYSATFKYNGKTYTEESITGSKEIQLTTILTPLEITGTVTAASVSEDQGMTVTTTALTLTQAFGSGWLKVTVNGTEYHIVIESSPDTIGVAYYGTLFFDKNGGSGEMILSDPLDGTRTDAVYVREYSNYTLPACGYTAPDGYEFSKWEINGTQYSAGDTYLFGHTTTAKAIWKLRAGVHDISASYESNNGDVVITPTKAAQGETVTVTVQPIAGKAIDSITYSHGSTSGQSLSGGNGGIYTFSMPNENTTVSVTFKDAAITPIPYVDGNGSNQTCNNYRYVRSNDTSWSGWVVASQNLTLDSRVTVNGTVNLILMDGKTLTVTNGIQVSAGATLNIYSQSGNTGALIAGNKQNSYAAGIGGNKGSYNAGTITINGGQITATGGYSSAGIGGSSEHYPYLGNAGTITIRGNANVSATGGAYSSGIGCGSGGIGGSITIEGNAVVHAKALDGSSGSGAAIGSGRGGYVNSITISGGTVIATGGTQGSAIGNGDSNSGGDGGTIRITGGNVTAIATGSHGAGIGGLSKSITIGGNAVVHATGANNGAGIGGYYQKAVGNITIEGNANVTATGGASGACIGTGSEATGEAVITIKGGTVNASMSASNGAAAIGSGYRAKGKTTVSISGGTVTASGSTVYGVGIGGGNKGAAGEEVIVNITGGTVRASGRAGIGTANASNAKLTVNISGGSVIASGAINNGNKGAAIGQGNNSNSVTEINITGGVVKTLGTGSGIGAGAGSQQTPTITLSYTDATKDSIEITAIDYNGTVTLSNNFKYQDGTGAVSIPITANKTIVSSDSTAHTHSFTYTVDGKTITATCANSDNQCNLSEHKATLTIGEPDGKTSMVYDGSAKAAVLTGNTDVLIVDIVYKKGDTVLPSAPSDVGSYTASIMLGEATATVSYEITKKTVTFASITAKDKVYDGTTKASCTIGTGLNGAVSGDNVYAYVYTGNATFEDANVGVNKKVTFSNWRIEGTAKGNYELIQPEPQYRAITPRVITITAKGQTVAQGGTVVSAPEQVDVTSGTLVTGHSISEITLTGDTSSVTTSGTITPNAVKIVDSSSNDVTANYLVNYTAGTLIVTEAPAHTHSFTYAANGATITATCANTDGNCPLTNSQATLTIAAPESLTYDGTAKAATVTGDTDFLGTPSIVYTKNGAAFTGTPTEPGVYTASITLGTATASVTYEIQSVKYNITISNANTGGTVTPDKTQAAFGETVTLTISPAPGYELDTLTAAKTDDSTTTVAVSGTGNTRTFTMPAYPVTVSATFSQIDYTITKATMTNGGVTVKVGETEAASAHYGDTVTLIPAPATGCALSSLTVCKTGDESTTVSVANNQFTMPAYPVTVSATFSLIPITGIGLSSSTITMTYGDAATSLAATVSPETALNTKVKFSVSSGADKIKLYKDASCTQEIGASDEFSSGTSIYVKPLASGTATITAVSVGDATKTASCAVTINKATPNLSGTLSCSATYGDTIAAVKIWLDIQSPLGVDNTALNGSWAWVDVQDSDPVGNVGNHSYQARFTPTDSNYNSITKTVEVIVDPKSLSPDDVDVSLSAYEFTYNGAQQAPTVNVTDTAATLTGNDYTISYKKKTDENTWEAVSETTDAGNYKAVVTGQGNYTGTVEKAFTINRCAVTVSVDDKTVEYNGSEQSGNTAYTFSNVVNGHTASITYTPAKGTLPSDTAYDNGSYGDDFQVMAGQQDVTANYTLTTKTAGKLTINNRAEKYEITVEANSNIGVYDGTEKTASGFVTSTFTVDGNTYEVSGLSTSNPKSTAVCSLTNTITGKAEVKDANGNDVTAQFNVILTNGSLEITPKSITGATVTLNQTQLGYTSAEQTVTVTGVAIDGLTLTENDYDVTGNTGTNAANYTVTVTGKGNFKDTATAGWKITEAGMTVSAPDVSATYDGQAHGVAVTVTEPAGAVIKFKDEAGAYTLDASPTITNAGKLVVGYQITADNYTPVTGSATVTIAPKAATVTASAQTVKEGESIQTGTAWATLTDALSGHTLGAVTLTAENGKIVPSAAKIQDAKGNDVTGNYAVSYQPGALTALGKISRTVTFKVVNGSWDDGSAETKTVTLTGFAGDTLKLAAADIPAVGAKPGDAFKAGAWDVTPSAEAEVLADTTYTYTYADKDAISQTVTFKVANGSWDDGTTADKVATLNGLEGETLKLAANQIPAVGTKPNSAFKAGSWDVTPDTETAITQAATYTYTYALRDAYLVTVTNDGNGTGSASPNSGYEGTEVTLTAYPAQGYKFKEWQVVSGGVTVTNNRFIIGAANVEVKAVFEAQATGWHKGETQIQTGAPVIQCSNMQEVVESIIAAIQKGEMKGISEEVRQAVSQSDARVLVLFISAPLSPDQIPAEDWAALQKLQEEAGYTGIVPFDITLMLNVNGQDVAEVHETKIPVKFSVGIMENLLDKTRQFALANVHNGAAKVLPTTRRGNFLDGESTEFSTYAIAYKDEETSTDTPAPTSTPAPVIDPTKFDDVAVPSGSFTFKKVWQGDSEKSIDFTLYRQGGKVYHHGFDKKVVSDKEWQYDAWFSAPAACYVIEKPIPGYQTKYVNVGVYAGITDRCCDGGTIINKKIPKTGDEEPLLLWAGMVALGALGLTVVLVIGKKRKANQ